MPLGWLSTALGSQQALFLSVGAFAQTKKGCVCQAGWLPTVRNLRALGPPSAAQADLPFPHQHGDNKIWAFRYRRKGCSKKTPRWLAIGTLLFQGEALLPKLSRKPHSVMHFSAVERKG